MPALPRALGFVRAGEIPLALRNACPQLEQQEQQEPLERLERLGAAMPAAEQPR
ncbi:hypothetical protein AB0B50_14075 [Streptomyces sp. NPDC041068]|uniref:hypothetical protein n=1 Tax=Streptomyces sp. NPDC041068 TaxID=3155130 RepID=UPI0033C33228